MFVLCVLCMCRYLLRQGPEISALVAKLCYGLIPGIPPLVS